MKNQLSYFWLWIGMDENVFFELREGARHEFTHQLTPPWSCEMNAYNTGQFPEFLYCVVQR